MSQLGQMMGLSGLSQKENIQASPECAAATTVELPLMQNMHLMFFWKGFLESCVMYSHKSLCPHLAPDMSKDLRDVLNVIKLNVCSIIQTSHLTYIALALTHLIMVIGFHGGGLQLQASGHLFTSCHETLLMLRSCLCDSRVVIFT